MKAISDTLWIEFAKAFRSRVPLLTGAGILIFPLAAAFIMFIYKEPEFARNLGILNMKAELTAGQADWPTYLSVFSQGIAIAGIFLFCLVCSWVFGREFVDGTVKELLAVPVARSKILIAKFIVVSVWCMALTLEVIAVGLPLGALLQLPQVAGNVIVLGAITTLITAALVVIGIFPFAFLASLGRGYLLPLGGAMIAVALANVIAVIGWGSYFPWSIPALFAGAGGDTVTLTPVSYAIVLATGMTGILLVNWWWNTADMPL